MIRKRDKKRKRQEHRTRDRWRGAREEERE